MKKYIITKIIKLLYWLMFNKGERLRPEHLIANGWIEIESSQPKRRQFIEPNIKQRDKVWIEFEYEYYRVFHSEHRTFITLENSKEWLSLYLFILDKHSELNTRKVL